MTQGHEKCGRCEKTVGHGRHYPGPYYYCECGFSTSRHSELMKHLQREQEKFIARWGQRKLLKEEDDSP